MALTDRAVEAHVLREFAEDAVCAVVGGYKGDTILYLLQHGAAFVAATDPQIWAHEDALHALQVRYSGRDYLYDYYALVAPVNSRHGEGTALLHGYGTDAARLYVPFPPDDSRSRNEVKPVRTKNVLTWIQSVWDRTGYTRFDFTVLNCEGAEDQLLPYFLRACDTVLVQYHGKIGSDWPESYGPLREVVHVGANWYLYKAVESVR